MIEKEIKKKINLSLLLFVNILQITIIMMPFLIILLLLKQGTKKTFKFIKKLF